MGRRAGYVLDAGGALHPFSIGDAPMPPPARTDTYGSADVARGVELLDSASGGYWLDAAGGLHPFAIGDAPMPPRPALSWYEGGRAKDFALVSGNGGYVLDDSGALHPFQVSGPMPPPMANPDVRGVRNVAREVVLRLRGTRGEGYWLDSAGGLHPVAPAGTPLPPRPQLTWYVGGRARAVVRNVAKDSGYVVDSGGALHPYRVGEESMPPPATTPDTYGSADVIVGADLR